jgi:hypothetical protein
MTGEAKPETNKDPELKRPDQAIVDLTPDEQESEAIRGGGYSDTTITHSTATK